MLGMTRIFAIQMNGFNLQLRMVRILGIVFVFLSGLLLNAQEKGVDYDDIRKNISKKNSKFYYFKLLEKFDKPTKTLSADEFTHLYYGWAYSSNYKPRFEIPYKIVDIITQDSISTQDLMLLNKWIDHARENDPFNPELLWLKYYYTGSNNDDAKEEWKARYSGIIKAIMNSGKGTKEEPYKLLYQNHHQSLLDFFGLSSDRYISNGHVFSGFPLRKCFRP